MTLITKDTTIYYISDNVCYNPPVTMNEDTGKIGVTFAVYSPFLAECEVMNRDRAYINLYHLTKDLTVSNGKYSFTQNKPEYYSRNGWDRVYPEDNVSHIDRDIITIYDQLNSTDNISAELFLNNIDIYNIEYEASYSITKQECLSKYGRFVNRVC